MHEGTQMGGIETDGAPENTRHINADVFCYLQMLKSIHYSA